MIYVPACRTPDPTDPCGATRRAAVHYRADQMIEHHRSGYGGGNSAGFAVAL